MDRTKSQAQLRYHQTMIRILELEALADQLQKLGRSYQKGTGERTLRVRESGAAEEYAVHERQAGETLLAQAREIRDAAEDWYCRAREEYHSSMKRLGQYGERRM